MLPVCTQSHCTSHHSVQVSTNIPSTALPIHVLLLPTTMHTNTLHISLITAARVVPSKTQCLSAHVKCRFGISVCFSCKNAQVKNYGSSFHCLCLRVLSCQVHRHTHTHTKKHAIVWKTTNFHAYLVCISGCKTVLKVLVVYIGIALHYYML